ncbi:TPA: hypothetical protein KD131_003202 [Vibrio parahaemolyticus]|nr:hypothetical protein [Vibrio parahaemolyticus]ELA9724526.1 hypothetical protein [Vibrio parahaemolyticus]HBC3611232.1 hypothetical protein [Vibrio parahaemolyticus]
MISNIEKSHENVQKLRSLDSEIQVLTKERFKHGKLFRQHLNYLEENFRKTKAPLDVEFLSKTYNDAKEARRVIQEIGKILRQTQAIVSDELLRLSKNELECADRIKQDSAQIKNQKRNIKKFINGCFSFAVTLLVSGVLFETNIIIVSLVFMSLVAAYYVRKAGNKKIASYRKRMSRHKRDVMLRKEYKSLMYKIQKKTAQNQKKNEAAAHSVDKAIDIIVSNLNLEDRK